ncbi:hypothetical protein GSI_14805 [Ganoderma sinense ZZ0214-1]|uniref:Uncharacterized protein n=1 Tax=Ganoderma sinense ZZ0214-1 TaxID=1077348 RepID=A0A2G8RPQ4_9APHY|nr:hypothetical protein GSI_14805 [Ganoderma sinense ZZ0214-1]
MCFSLSLSSLAAILAATTVMVSAQNPLPTPQFEPLFAGEITLTSGINTTSPFGTRVHYDVSGGNVTDARTGERVATILACADDGIVSNSGIFFPEAVLPLVWDVDGHLASIRVKGIGNLVLATHYAHVETDSPTYSWMNSNFFIIARNATDPTHPVFTIFGISNSSSSSSGY